MMRLALALCLICALPARAQVLDDRHLAVVPRTVAEAAANSRKSWRERSSAL